MRQSEHITMRFIAGDVSRPINAISQRAFLLRTADELPLRGSIEMTVHGKVLTKRVLLTKGPQARIWFFTSDEYRPPSLASPQSDSLFSDPDQAPRSAVVALAGKGYVLDASPASVIGPQRAMPKSVAAVLAEVNQATAALRDFRP